MSTNKKQDLRITRTQRALVAAMLALLEKNGFQKTTVNDLCDMAMVSRTTFYQHFEDKYHLLRFSLEQMQSELRERVEEGDIDALIAVILEHLESQGRAFRGLLREEMNYELLRMFSEVWVRDLTRSLEEHTARGKVFQVPVQALAVYMAGGAAQLLVWWLESGFSPPREEMARCLKVLTLAAAGVE